jgi:hypothetical protein
VVEVVCIKMINLHALGEGVIEIWIASSNLGGFVLHSTGGVIEASPRRSLWSKIVPSSDLQEPSVSSSGVLRL